MITVNTYIITERAVYEAVAIGIQKLANDKSANPEKIIDTLAAQVMSNLCDVLDFGIQPVRFTPQLMQKMWQLAKDEERTESERAEHTGDSEPSSK